MDNKKLTRKQILKQFKKYSKMVSWSQEEMYQYTRFILEYYYDLLKYIDELEENGMGQFL